MKTIQLSIYCDGGARGKPGPAASAFVVQDSSGKILHEQGFYLGPTTNNQAEYEAVIQALKWVSTLHNSSFNIHNSSVDYIFEPSPKELIEGLVNHLVRMQVYHLVLEANASEHSARMVAMKTASDNAKELSEKLNLEYNKARQAGITKELIEITSAVNTLS